MNTHRSVANGLDRLGQRRLVVAPILAALRAVPRRPIGAAGRGGRFRPARRRRRRTTRRRGR